MRPVPLMLLRIRSEVSHPKDIGYLMNSMVEDISVFNKCYIHVCPVMLIFALL